jgi:hypothetical protein
VALGVGFLGQLAAPAAHAGNSLYLALGPNGFSGLVLVDATFNGSSGGFYAGIQYGSLNGGPTFDAYCVDL